MNLVEENVRLKTALKMVTMNEEIIEKKLIDRGLFLVSMSHKLPDFGFDIHLDELCCLASLWGISSSAEAFREELELLNASLPKKP